MVRRNRSIFGHRILRPVNKTAALVVAKSSRKTSSRRVARDIDSDRARERQVIERELLQEDTVQAEHVERSRNPLRFERAMLVVAVASGDGKRSVPRPEVACRYCGKARKRLREHLIKQHPSRVVSCPKCHELVSRRRGLRHDCISCGTRFSVSSRGGVMGRCIRCCHCEVDQYVERSGRIRCSSCRQFLLVNQDYTLSRRFVAATAKKRRKLASVEGWLERVVEETKVMYPNVRTLTSRLAIQALGEFELLLNTRASEENLPRWESVHQQFRVLVNSKGAQRGATCSL